MKKKNLLYVFPDQFRTVALSLWQDERYQSHIPGKPDPVVTPNLDKLAKQGATLPNAVSNCPVCSPHRGSLFTGNYPNKSGVPLNCNSNRINSELPQSQTCFTDVLSQADYHVGYIGKWHLDLPTPNDPANPGHYVESRRPAWDSYTEPQRRHGIDYWYGYGTFDQHTNPHYYDTNGVRHEPKIWSAEHEADKAISYILNKEGERDTNKPFALFVSMNPPHSPYNSLDDCRAEDLERYQGWTTSDLLVRDNADLEMDKAKCAPYYFANVDGVDKEFGRIIDALKQAGELENTLVVFTSDHGETLCTHGIEDAKNVIYNESLSVPFIIRAPNVEPQIHPLQISSPDIMPTVLGLLELGDLCPQDIQGRDLSPYLIERKQDAQMPDCALYLRNIDGEKNQDGQVVDYFPVSRGIRTERYSLAFEIDRNFQLAEIFFFDNQQDPYQLNNLPFDQANVREQWLLELFANELARIEDPWFTNRVLPDLFHFQDK